MATIDDQVEELNDDAIELLSGSSFSSTNATVILGGGTFKLSGQKFDTLITGLSGVTITDAYLTWRAHVTDSDSFVGTMYGEDSAAPAVFDSSNGDIAGRVRTTATVAAGSAELGSWTGGEDYTLTVTSIIQELVDSYDPSAILLLYIWTSGSGERIGKAFGSDEVNAPKLHITFTPAAGGDELVIVHNTTIVPGRVRVM